MKSLKSMVAYLAVAGLGLMLAFMTSMYFLAPAHSQSDLPPPSMGDLPPEFQNQMGSAPANPPPAEQLPPPPPAETAPSEASGGEGGSPVDPGLDLQSVPVPASGPDGYVYDPTGRRDPFKPYKALRISSQTSSGGGAARTGEEPIEPLDPLQRWDLDRLAVIGILWDVKAPKAVLRDPDGATYIVTKSSKIGRNQGYVATIREGEIVVIETLEVEGQVRREPKVLELKN